MGPSLHRIWNAVSHVNGLCFLVFSSVPSGSPRPLCSRFVPSCGVTASFTYLVFPCVLFHQPGAAKAVGTARGWHDQAHRCQSGWMAVRWSQVFCSKISKDYHPSKNPKLANAFRGHRAPHLRYIWETEKVNRVSAGNLIDRITLRQREGIIIFVQITVIIIIGNNVAIA